MAEDDLAEHSSEWVAPLSVEYDGVRLHEIPPNVDEATGLVMESSAYAVGKGASTRG